MASGDGGAVENPILKAIDAVAVRIDTAGTTTTLEDVGLDAPALATYAASRVARVGLPVVAEEDRDEDTPVLSVRISMFTVAPPAPQGLVVYRVDLHLYKSFNDPLIGRMFLPVWTKENQGVVGNLVAKGGMPGTVSDAADAFAAQWLASRRTE